MAYADSIIRQMKIDLITDTYNSIIKNFLRICKNLYIIETNVYHDRGGEIVYHRIVNGRKEWLFYYDDDKKRLWCNSKRYWDGLRLDFKLDSFQVQEITHFLFDEILSNENTILTMFNVPNPEICSIIADTIIETELDKTKLENSLKLINDEA